jgi:hypothetical protein
MHDGSVPLKKLTERVLGKGGDLPLVLLLELLVPVRRLRELAAELGLSPKGGFRLDKAPAHVLAPLLAELRDAEQLDRVLRLLVPTRTPDKAQADADPDPAVAEATALAHLRGAELARARDELERARESAARARDRENDLARRLELAVQELALHRRAAEPRAGSDGPGKATSGPAEDKELLRRVHELAGEREGLLEAHEALRRQRAHDQSRLRELEATITELEALLPKGKRRRKPQPEPVPEPAERRFLLPRFLQSFYKSLEGKDRKSVARAFAAILQFCTEGHAYPGLEVKQLGGQDTWSLRASLGLRVYFRSLPDGDIELIELGNREDQNTTLRRLKDR